MSTSILDETGMDDLPGDTTAESITESITVLDTDSYPADDAPVTRKGTLSNVEPDYDEDDAPAGSGRQRRKRNFFSGWCGSGPCLDNKASADGRFPAVRRCTQILMGGANAVPGYAVCDCDCHADDELPDMSAHASRFTVPVASSTTQN